MDAGILRALKTVKDNRYVQYVGLGLAGLVTQEEQLDQDTGKPLRKSKYQLIRISAAVCGIELCYAAETAFVSPILLKLGVPPSLMTMVWCLSPIVGFFLVPFMGSLSDRCRLKIGRRRPFIIILSIGIVFGLALVPNGQIFGVLLGDTWNDTHPAPSPRPPLSSFGLPSANAITLDHQSIHRVTPLPSPLTDKGNLLSFFNKSSSSPSFSLSLSSSSSFSYQNKTKIDSVPSTGHRFHNESTDNKNRTDGEPPPLSLSVSSEHLRGIILTILGVALLDFNCDACQSPCRAYLLDVSVPEDHSQGLTMFTVMAGAGGAVGYVMGGIDWNSTSFGEAFGGHIRVVFTLVLIAFFICMTSTLTSFREIPLSELNVSAEKLQTTRKKKDKKKYKKFTNEEESSEEEESPHCKPNYGALADTEMGNQTKNIFANGDKENEHFTEEMYSTRVEDTSKSSRMCSGEISGLKALSITEINPNPNNEVSSQMACKEELEAHDIPQTYAKNNSQLSGGLTEFSSIAPDTNLWSGKAVTSRKELTSLIDRTFETNVHINGHVVANNSVNPHPTPTNVMCQTQSESKTSKEISHYVTRGDTSHKSDDVIATIDLLEVSTDVTLKTYLRSIVRMPRCMWILCLTNLFCWMSLVCYSLYFTDFVGQAVFQGNPQSPAGSREHNLYDEGIRLGSLGMSLYSLSCACYSLVIEKLVQRFQAKRVYVIGQLVYTVGMMVMALSRSKVAVILISPTAGVMYATLFTMPYLVVAHYHARGMFSQSDSLGGEELQVRGLGTDVAIISSMVFLAQFLLSVFMGTAVSVLRSTTTVVVVSSVLSFMGAVTATQITYLDL